MRSTPVLLLAVVALATCGATALAQRDRRATHATLIVDNQARLLLQQIDEALRTGDERAMIELTDRLLESEDVLLPLAGQPVYLPAWRAVQPLLARFPASAVQMYRQLHDPEIAQQWEQARRAGDVPLMARLFRRCRLSEYWPRIGRELATWYIDEASFASAIEVLEQLMAAGHDDELVQLRYAVALAGLGEGERARSIIERVEVRLAPDAPARQGCAAIRAWLAESGPADALQPNLQRGALWSANVVTVERPIDATPSAEIVRAIARYQRLPMFEPGLGDEVVVVRTPTQVVAFDAGTLDQRWWNTADRVSASSAIGRIMTQLRMQFLDDEYAGMEDRPVPSVLVDRLDFAAAVVGGRVFTIEQGEAGGDTSASSTPEPTVLVARDAASGALLWRLGDGPDEPLFGAAFLALPQELHGNLIVPVYMDGHLELVEIEPLHCKILRRTVLVGQPVVAEDIGGRVYFTVADDGVYISTGNGVVLALDPERLAVRWAATYPSRAFVKSMLDGSLERSRISFEAARPVVTADAVIVAPADCDQFLVLGRFDGALRARVPRGVYPLLVGATADRVVLAGEELACWRLNSLPPDEPEWRTVPLVIAGRPVMTSDRIYVPVPGAIVVVDVASGKIVDEQRYAEDDGPSVLNLAVHGGAMWAASDERIIKFPDVARLRALTDADSPEKAVLAAWIDLFDGHCERAIERVTRAGAGTSASSRVLLRAAYSELAAQRNTPGERAELLLAAAAAADDPVAWSRLQLQAARELAHAGETAEAVELCLRLLTAPRNVLLPDGRQPRQRTAAWRLAGRLLRELWPQLDTTDRVALLAKTLELDVPEGVSRIDRLRRLWRVLPDGPARVECARRLTLSRIPPEEKIAYLLPDDPDQPIEQRLRWLLEQWETHVSLGMFEQARADAQAWDALRQERSARATSQPAARLPGKLRRRAAALRLALRKAKVKRSEPFGTELVRLWRVENAEQVFDPRDIERCLGRWQLLIDAERGRLLQIDAEHYERPLRSVSLSKNADGSSVSLDFWWMRTTWWGPSNIHAVAVGFHRVVVAGSHGLVCAGLGRERYGGRWLWFVPLDNPRRWLVDLVRTACPTPEGLAIAVSPDTLAMLDWNTGEVLWRRTLGDCRIDGLTWGGGRLVVSASGSLNVGTLDAAGNEPLREIQPEDDAVVSACPVGDVIVVTTSQYVMGYDAGSLQPVWQVPPAHGIPMMGETRAFPHADCLAYRLLVDQTWYALDTKTGRELVPDGLGQYATVSAMARRDGMLLTAGVLSGEPGADAGVELRAWAEDTGELLWSVRYGAAAIPNITQLVAHPRLIPVLVLEKRESELAQDTFVPQATIVLLEAASGREVARRVVEMRPVSPGLADERSNLLVTPACIMVGCGGDVVAYGSLEEE